MSNKIHQNCCDVDCDGGYDDSNGDGNNHANDTYDYSMNSNNKAYNTKDHKSNNNEYKHEGMNI